jgi:hypothetical protein
MDPAPPPFQGWERPARNFYRLPHTWFATLTRLRRAWQLRSIANLIRLVEYIIRWTWGEGHFDRPVRLTLDELEHGKVIGRRNGLRLRADAGCGISGSHLSEAIQLAVDLGLITREVDRRDPGRIRQFFAPRLADPSPPSPSSPRIGERRRGEGGGERSVPPASPFPGFPLPHSNYFIVPKAWISLMARTRSDTLILAMEYLMRHCWGWQARADEVHFLTADEVARGRRHADGTRYDDGIGYSVERTRDALERAVADGWLVVRERTSHGGRPVREYTLRRLGWPPGEWQPPDRGQNQLSDVSEGDTDVSAAGTDASAEVTDISAGAKDPSAGGTDTSPPRTDVPTPPTNAAHRPPTAPPPPAPGGGGDGGDRGGLTLRFTPPTGGPPVEAHGRVRRADGDLGPDEVLLAGEGGEGVIAVSVAEAARLLAEGVDAACFGWAADWWNLDEEARWEIPEARARCEKAREQASALRRRREEWGDDDLVRALARYDVAPETAARWIARWGEERVGAWLATLRRDPRVETVAGLLLRKLQSGQTPPAWVVAPRR